MLYSLFEKAAARFADKPAIKQEGRSLSYAALDALVCSLAANLTDAGVEPRALVGVCIDSKPETLALYLALARLGARLASLDSAYTQRELAQIFERCQPPIIVCDARYLEKMRGALAGAHQPRLISEGTQPFDWSWLFRARGQSSKLARAQPFSEAFQITFTSGSTGRPKGIVLSQKALCHRVQGWIDHAALTPADEHLWSLTLAHAVGPQYGAFPALCSGATLHLLDPRLTTPLRALRYIQEHAITCFGNLPYFYQLMAGLSLPEQRALPTLRLANAFAAPLPVETARAFRAKFGVALRNCYGLSECGVVTVGLTESSALGATSIGSALDGVELRLLPHGGRALDEEGLEGELAVRSPTLADGYFSPENGPMLSDGWLHTADVARRGADGNLYVVSRLSQFINVAGNKVSPIEIETVIGELEGVRDVAVVGVADPRTTQKVAAFVVAGEGVSVERILERCRERCAAFKVPSYVELRSELPKSSLGKTLKTQLQLSAPAQAGRAAG